jgi:hypothetical protein
MSMKPDRPDLPQGSRLWFIDEAGQVQCVPFDPFDDGLQPQPASELETAGEQRVTSSEQ